MLEELSIILCFLNPFLARMPEDARTQLCSFLKLETLARDTVIWSQGDDISKFYLILSGEHAVLFSASGALCALRTGVAPRPLADQVVGMLPCSQRAVPCVHSGQVLHPRPMQTKLLSQVRSAGLLGSEPGG